MRKERIGKREKRRNRKCRRKRTGSEGEKLEGRKMEILINKKI